MRIICLITIVLTFLTSCHRELEGKDLYGFYIPINYKNTFDTIQLKSNNLYSRKVYDKRHKLVLKMNGKWELSDKSIIQFYSYFSNFDRDLIKYPELIQDISGSVSSPLEVSKGTIMFCTGYYQDQNCYKKIAIDK